MATAWAPDGTIEAVENPGDRLVLGVQWHAEGLRAHDPLFELLIAAAAGGREQVAEPRVAEPRRLASARRRSVRPRRPAAAQRLASRVNTRLARPWLTLSTETLETLTGRAAPMGKCGMGDLAAL